MEQCVALCDYSAEADDEISFKKGDVITVVAKGSASGFWEGILNGINPNKDSKKPVEPSQLIGKRGLFPNCFVTSNMRPHVPPTFCDKCIALYDYNAKDKSELYFKKGDCITVVKPSSSAGWWYGINESMLQRLSAAGGPSDNKHSIAASCGTAQKPLLFPSNFVSAKIVIAAFGFTGRQAHELSFNAGDVILIYRKWNDGWWEGSLQGRRGIFPSNYSLANIATTTPPFFCYRCRTIFQTTLSESCSECSKNEEITSSMLRAVDDFKKGVLKSATLDLFAYVELDPAKGGRSALLSLQDTVDRSVRKEPRDAVPRD